MFENILYCFKNLNYKKLKKILRICNKKNKLENKITIFQLQVNKKKGKNKP